LTLTKLSTLTWLTALSLLLARLPLLLGTLLLGTLLLAALLLAALLLAALSLLLARLPAHWILPAPSQRFDLAAEAFDVVQRSGLLTLAWRWFAWAQPLLRLVHLLV
jgi:hypothetical protein